MFFAHRLNCWWQINRHNVIAMMGKIAGLQRPGCVVHGRTMDKDQPGLRRIVRTPACRHKYLLVVNLYLHVPNPAARL